MNNPSTLHQVTYSLSIRSDHKPLSSPIFHGALETITGQKFEFKTLAELNGLLCEIAGWIDKPWTEEEGETNPQKQ